MLLEKANQQTRKEIMMSVDFNNLINVEGVKQFETNGLVVTAASSLEAFASLEDEEDYDTCPYCGEPESECMCWEEDEDEWMEDEWDDEEDWDICECGDPNCDGSCEEDDFYEDEDDDSWTDEEEDD